MKRNWLEWMILIASVVLVAVLAGYLLVAGVTNVGDAEVRAEAAPGAATQGPDGGWLVPIIVRNDGGEAALSVVIEGTATVEDAEETSEQTVDILAADSEVELVLGFSAEPDGAVELRVVAYETP
ncbi:MAG: hypothetical protein ABIZ34_06540 [Candidatus Limnocylindrales bacterium]